MAASAPEDLFLCFRERGDVDALGRLFDLAAPDLLRTALHLVRDPLAADDLLQSTFLTAIERAGAYDQAQPLLPWLTGILANHARRWRRRRSTEALPEQDPVAPAGDPSDAARLAELNSTLARQIDLLDPPEREVVALQALHGFEPAQIAYVLGRSPSTVRSQLRRARRRLRERLPRELTLPGLIACGPRFDLVRAAVLEQGGKTPVALASTAAAAGGIALKKTVIGIALVLAVGGVAALGGLRGQDPEGPLAIAPPAVDRVQASSRSDSLPDLLDTGAAQRTARAARQAPVTRDAPVASGAEEGADESDVNSFQAVVTDEAGDPIANATVELTRLGSRASWVAASAGVPAASGVTVVRTDAGGRAHFRYPRWNPAGDEVDQLSFQVGRMDYASASYAEVNVRPTSQTFVLKRGCTLLLTAYIGDPANRVPFVPRISASAGLPEVGGDGSPWEAMGEGLGSTQLVEGRHELLLVHQEPAHGGAGGGGVYTSDVVTVEVTPEGVTELSLELRPARVLKGRLDDSVPRPVRDGLVEVHLSRWPSDRHLGVHVFGHEPIDADGTFTLRGLPALPGQLYASCTGFASEFSPIGDPRAVDGDTRIAELARSNPKIADLLRARREAQGPPAAKPGDDSWIEVAMRPSGTLAVVLTGPDGEPIPGVHLDLTSQVTFADGCVPTNDWHALATTDVQGIARFEGLLPGPALLTTRHETLGLPHERGRHGYYRRRSVRVSPDETLTIEIELEER